MTGFTVATEKLAAIRIGELRRKGRRTLLDSKARAREAKAGMVINRACRRHLRWLHSQPWYGISKDVINHVQTGEVVRAKAVHAAAERVVGKYLMKWAHQRTEEKGKHLINRVRRKMAIHKIGKLVTSRKRRPYQYRLAVCRM
jgi:hypothetical protein